jgi:hypothetical protein
VLRAARGPVRAGEHLDAALLELASGVLKRLELGRVRHMQKSAHEVVIVALELRSPIDHVCACAAISVAHAR